MRRILITAAAAALLAHVAVTAEARPVRTPAKAQPSAALKARQSAMHDFDTRMSRLDRLMGIAASAPARSRSAEAGR
jgi:hypothetical protein